MAKKRAKRSKCIEPFNTLIDLAAGFVMFCIADKKQRKNPRKNIDPYIATGVAMSLGKLDSTDDLIRFGGMLGALGAFDDEPYDDSDIFGNDPICTKHVQNNTWRDYCEDGSEFGISPYEYENPDDYNDAIDEARQAEHTKQYCAVYRDVVAHPAKPQRSEYCWRKYCEDGSLYGIDPNDYETADDYVDALKTAQNKACD